MIAAFAWRFVCIGFLLVLAAPRVQAGAGVLGPGETMQGTFTTQQQTLTYTFTVTTGYSAAIFAQGSLYVYMAVYRPDGSLLASPPVRSDGTFLPLTQLTEPGTYTVTLSADLPFYQYSASFYITLMLSPGHLTWDTDPDGGPISSAETRQGTLPLGDLDAYTFTASAGDTIAWNVDAAGEYDTRVYLYDPTGAEISDARMDIITATRSGTYLLLLRNPGTSSTVPYAVSFQKMPGNTVAPDETDGGSISPGEIKSGSLLLADLDTYSFQAKTGDAVDATIASNGAPSSRAQVVLIGPSGAIDSTYTGYSSPVAELYRPVQIQQDGTYYLLVSGDTDVNYLLSLALVPGDNATPTDPDGGLLINGQPRTGTFTPADMDVYHFTAVAGSTVSVHCQDSGGVLPSLMLINPDGTYADNFYYAPVFQTGTYWLICTDPSGDANDPYTISVTVTPNHDIPDAKLGADGATAQIPSCAVTAVFGDCIYIESPDRASGMRVIPAPNQSPVSVGSAFVDGILDTLDSGERCIENAYVWNWQDSPYNVAPLFLPPSEIGGGDFHYDPATGVGQQGVSGGAGLNNIGLLVTVSGRVVAVGADGFTIDDGSCPGSPLNVAAPASVQAGWYVQVTGVVSCYRSGGRILPLIRVSSQENVQRRA